LEPSNFYSILGVSRNATQEEIRKAYFDAARRLHPDTNNAPGDTEFFIGAKEAYEVLSDVKKRANYDAGLPPEKPVYLPVNQRVVFSRENLVPMQEAQLVYVLLEYTPIAENLENIPSPPLNICLLIDRSTSMKGQNLDIVKATAIQILRRLRSQDTLSLIAFSDRAEVMVPSTRNGDLIKLEARIQMLQTSGGTEIYNGLVSAYTEVKRAYNPAYINHIILLTDGRTFGDENNCLELAYEAAKQNIGISGLGIGHEWNDEFLDELARRTGGSCIYVSKPQDIQRLLMEKFDHLWQIYADNVILEFNVKENVELRYTFRLQPELGLLPSETPLQLGPVLRSGCLKLLMEFMVTATENTNVIELLEGLVKVSIASINKPPSTFNIHLIRPVSKNSTPEPPPQEIIQALSRLTLYRLQEQARLEVTAGAYDQASKHLQRLATHLLQQGNRELARTVLLEAESIKEKQTYSLEGDKRIKYGTRALLLPGSGAKPL
jgi:Ca-activated chloride channel family protein